MKNCRENVQSKFVLGNASCRPGLALLALLLLESWPIVSAVAQSGAAPPAKPQTSSQSQSQTASQSGSLPPTIAQTDSGDKPQSLGDAARKANAQKDKPKSKHVFTEDDISSVGGTISVVGNGSSADRSSENRNSSADAKENNTAFSKDEAFWRGKARALKDQIAAVDQQIEQKKNEIAKAGPTSFDPSTGLSQNVIIIHDRNAELKDLEDRKQRLEKQLDDLADEGRKAGADSGWFR
jgi:hypothetical protein